MGQARACAPCCGDGAKPLLGSRPKEAAPKLGPCGKVFIFVLFTQVVQALMSYDGGATQFCTFSLARNGWSPFELGLLGAMDKFGQVATAFVWGEVLRRRDAKLMLVVGLFWKALCCLVFGRLQELPVEPLTQLYMLAAKLGMGVTEALVSVWATVWVQRNAPADARARWLGFAGTSAGIGSGVGSGMASLWSPGGAFVVQAMVLFAIWLVLLLTPAWMLRFGEPSEEAPEAVGSIGEPESGSWEAETCLPAWGRRTSFGDARQMLAQEVACRTIAEPQPLSCVVTLESLRCGGQFLDATVEPRDDGFKVRLTRGDPGAPWAQFRMKRPQSHSGGTIVTFESTRLPGHYLDAGGSGETLCIPHSRVKVGIVEEDSSSASAHFRLHRDRLQEGVVRMESVVLPGYFLGATGESAALFSNNHTKVSVSRDGPSDGKWAKFRLREVDGCSPLGDPSISSASRGSRPGGVWQSFVVTVQCRLWLWTAMSISLCCFVTSGISFMWQNTVGSVWGFDNAWSFGLFVFSTGLGGLLGVALGPDIFDRYLGGFESKWGQALCLLWCKRMMLAAAVCSTLCAVLLTEKACHLVATNSQSAVIWQLVVLVACVFAIFVLINSITGVLYGINTVAVSEEMRTFAAGLTVSFQNVFGFAFGPLLPSAAAELVSRVLPREWPGFLWDEKAVDGAKYAVAMGVALAAAWALFVFARLSAVSARLVHISSRRLLDDQ